MTREEVLQVLTAQTGPLGPFGSPEEQEDQWTRWLESAPDDAVPPLLSLLREPPAGVRPDVWSEMELKIAEALGALGQREPAGFVAQVAPLLSEARARPVLLDALGMAKAREAIPVMSALLERGGLTEDELVRMAGALGAIGGMGASRLLDRMQPHAKDKPAALAELGVARDILAFDRADSGVLAHHLAHALKALAKGEQESFLEHALPLMERDALRKPFIELLGAVHSVPGLSWLSSKARLRAGELGLCARFLAEAGGTEARQALIHLLSRAEGSGESRSLAEQALTALRAEPVPTRSHEALGSAAQALGRMDRAAYRREVEPLLAEPPCRAAWLHMLEKVQSAEGLAWLGEPLQRSVPGDEELIRWLRALGAIGGAEAKAALEQFRSTSRAHSQPIQRELEQALALSGP